MNDEILAWHFLHADGKLANRDGREVKVGETLTVPGPLVMCQNGLHASRRAIDALQYAPGPIICRVRLAGGVLEGNDKLCATERMVLAMTDATTLLHEFACWCAEQALEKERVAGREPDPRSWAAIQAKRQWLNGEITDYQLTAAWDAAWDAARTSAWGAAGAAAWAAAWAAASAAAGAAANTASAAAWAAASAAAGAAANTAYASATDADWYAACAAAWDAQNEELERRLTALLEAQCRRV